MVSAVILIKTEVGIVHPVADQLARLKGVTEVLSVAGPYDLVALVRVRENEDLDDLVGEGISKVHGITATETLIAFRVYTAEERKTAFNLGVD
jgi:DNA-binding Lrp family transcriptional regulator